MSVPPALGTSWTKVPVLFCRSRQFTLVRMPLGLLQMLRQLRVCAQHPKVQEMLSRKKGNVGRRVCVCVCGRGAGEAARTLEGPSGAGPGDAHVS